MRKYIINKFSSINNITTGKNNIKNNNDQKKDNCGYVMILALLLISLIGLFIPFVIQQNQINFSITSKRAAASKYRTAAESGIEYLLQRIEKNSELPLYEEIALQNNINISVSGEEGDSVFQLISAAGRKGMYFVVEAEVDKESLDLVNIITRRSE